MTDPFASQVISTSPTVSSVPSPPVASVPAVRTRAHARSHGYEGRYDASATSDDNRRHWQYADGLSARAANSPQVRYRLRTRARYERDNNTYAKGIVSTLANDTVGTGPRLQMLTPDAAMNRAIERAFCHWADAVGLPVKLRTMRQSLAVDGESFAILTTNAKLKTPAQLDVRLIEADQVSTPNFVFWDPYKLDGIEFDHDFNPVQYHILKWHPGDIVPMTWEFDIVPATHVIHWFRKDRPGQVRGVPDITPALPLFAQLRRYTLAVLAAAETAADFSAVLYSDLAPDDETDDAAPFDALEINRRMMTTLPAGWKMGQFKAEQPTNTYKDFKGEVLNEIARCLNMPFNIAAGNSSGYNYSSGRLDHQTYYKSLRVDQADIESVILDRIFAAWVEEMALVSGLLPDQIPELPHQWFWDGHEHVDPMKEAAAQETRLRNNTTTLADEYARRGQDWEAQLRQRAKERALCIELGLPPDSTTLAGKPVSLPNEGGSNADPEDDS